jgi:hypothetical protein
MSSVAALTDPTEEKLAPFLYLMMKEEDPSFETLYFDDDNQLKIDKDQNKKNW